MLRRTEKGKSIGVSITGLQTSTQTVTLPFSSWTLHAGLSSFNTASEVRVHGNSHEHACNPFYILIYHLLGHQ